MCNDNAKPTAGTDAAPEKKMKLSEIMSAMESGNVELDCKAALLGFGVDYSSCYLNADKLDIKDVRDTQMMLVYRGVRRLIIDGMNFNPEASAVCGRFQARSVRETVKKCIAGALSDGEEGEDNE